MPRGGVNFRVSKRVTCSINDAIAGMSSGLSRGFSSLTKQAADTRRLADHIFIEELRNAGWYDNTSQDFAVFLPVKSVGVPGADLVGSRLP